MMIPDNNKRGNNSPERLVPCPPFQPFRWPDSNLVLSPGLNSGKQENAPAARNAGKTEEGSGLRKEEGKRDRSRRQMKNLTVHSPSSASREGYPVPLPLKQGMHRKKHRPQGCGNVHGRHEAQYGPARKWPISVKQTALFSVRQTAHGNQQEPLAHKTSELPPFPGTGKHQRKQYFSRQMNSWRKRWLSRTPPDKYPEPRPGSTMNSRSHLRNINKNSPGDKLRGWSANVR